MLAFCVVSAKFEACVATLVIESIAPLTIESREASSLSCSSLFILSSFCFLCLSNSISLNSSSLSCALFCAFITFSCFNLSGNSSKIRFADFLSSTLNKANLLFSSSSACCLLCCSISNFLSSFFCSSIFFSASNFIL